MPKFHKLLLTLVFTIIGLSSASFASAASNVYYSVGQSTADLKTGTPNVAITSGVATFDVAQTANIGVGDVIVANAISYYIASKTSTTVWNVVTNTGAAPTDITSTAVTSVKHVYTSLNAAVTGASTLLGSSDLTTADVVLNIPCYYDSAADTTAVIVSGYTTDATRYIKIYTPSNTATESNNSQRANGKWNDTKYNLKVSTNNHNFDISISYVHIDGLQIYQYSDSPTKGGIYAYANKTGIEISNNIIRGNGNYSSATHFGINIADSCKIWNNIVYNFNATTSFGIQSTTSGTNHYIYNNTVYGCTAGILQSNATVILKNNIVYNNTTDYSGTFNSSSTNNLSKDGTAPPLNTYYTSKTLAFTSVTAGAEDFHLVSTDTDAINKGADLTSDANLPFSTDIDGQTRNLRSEGWDIGADEAVTQVYFSVGQNTTDHKTGSPLVTVSGTTATFSVAQTATNMGVGDLVTYAGGTCYISAKTSTTVWSCLSATGGTPTAATNATVTSIAHAFASLEGAVDANTATGAFDATHLNTKDLVTGNYQLNVPCYYDTGADTTAVAVQSWTTGAQNYIKIYTPYNTTSEVNQSQRHSGKWDAGKYRLDYVGGAGVVPLFSYLNNVWIDGLQIKKTLTQNYGNISVLTINAGNKVSNNIITIDNNYTNSTKGVYVGTGDGTFSYLWNNIIYGTGLSYGFYGINSFAYIYNNTVIGAGVAGYYSSWSNRFLLKNNIAQSCTDGFAGAFISGSDYNISDLATDTTGGAHDKQATVAFVDTANKDFHLAPTDTAAKNSGVDLSADASLPFTTDIDGAGRNSAVNVWDIGADETATQIFRSVGPSATVVLESDTSHARTVTLASGTATFNVALPDNIGVGDAVLIDTGGTDQAIDASDTLLFIQARTDSTHYTLQTASGAVPSNIAVNDTYQIYRAYISLANAEAGTKNTSIPIAFTGGDRDLVANNEQWNIACYANETTADTSGFNINGWNTAQQDYINIYTPVITTEVGASQRHSGKWDDSKYHLNSGGIVLYSKYIQINGLQININDSGSGIYTDSSTNGTDLKISNNIIKGTGNSATSQRGMRTIGYKTVEVWNNIIYDLGYNASTYGIGSYSGTYYTYNNTIINTYRGIYAEINNVVYAKNNIVQGCTDGYYGTFNAASDYNISDLAADTTGGAHDKQATVAFSDTTNKDFHLAPTDTAAKNSGVDLSADANLPFTTDIDGQTRSATPSWDIGADEAANAVYYSVGQSTADLKSGTPNVAITAGVATFDVAQTGNIGVGDVIVANAISYYIASKTSTTVWNVVTVTGATPTNITSTAVTSIKHVYSSLNSAAAGAGTLLGTSDLYINNYQINLPCYYDSAADTTAVTVSGYTTRLPNYIKIYTPVSTTTEANNSQRASGKWDTMKYISGGGVNLRVRYVRVDGLQITTPDPGLGLILYASNITSIGDIKISNCIIKGNNINQRGAYFNGIPATFEIWNNIFFNFSNDAGNELLSFNNTSTPVFIYNNTLIGGYRSIRVIGTGPFYAKNNLAQGALVNGYNGTFSASSTNNLSNLNDSPGTNPQNSKTVNFISTTSGSEDFHLASTDTSARNFGADLSADTSFAFATDIDGNARNSAITVWDIGADEAATQIFRSVAPGATGLLASDSSHANTITLTSGTATFSAALPDNIGVGDAVLIDTGGTDQAIDASDTLIFIRSRTDSTHYALRTQTGATPADITVNDTYQIYRAYTSLANAESGTKNTNIPISFNGGDRDLVVNNEEWNIACYANGTTADTTAVPVSGWLTNMTHYIKMYTPVGTSEVGTSQRNNGKWDDNKYYLYLTTGAAISNAISYVMIDGLQIKGNGTGGFGHSGIQSDITTGDRTGNIIVRNNIFRGFRNGISTYRIDTVGKMYYYNNIIYNGEAGYAGIYLKSESSATSFFVYDNTIYNCGIGIQREGSTGTIHVYAKNNLTQNCASGGFSGTFEATSTNNLSSDATSPNTGATDCGGHSCLNQTVNFVDPINYDFHLSPSDTAAKNSGADLSADANLPFATDIDGASRNASINAWDIGADETATQIYRSVGPSATTVLETDTSHARTVTLTSGVATFSNALADTIGVGDAVLIDTGGTDQTIDSADTILFISARTDSTHYTLQTQTGAVPANIASNDTYQIYRAYTSLSLAEAGTKNTSIPISFTGGDRDLVTNNEQWNIACYANGLTADTTAVAVSGWTTAQQDFIKIYTPVGLTEVGTSQRHSGKWDSGKYRLEVDATYVTILDSIDNNVVIDGLQIKFIATNYSQAGLRIRGKNNYISNNIIQGSISGSASNNYAIYPYYVSNPSNMYIWNNIVYGFNSSGGAGISLAYTNNVYLYNNTLYGNASGIKVPISSSAIAKNNIAYNNDTDYVTSGTGYFNSASTNNLSKDATAPAYGTYYRNATVNFADTANKDFHLAPTDTAAKNSGADLSADTYLPFTTDIDRQTRSSSPGWDIGADEAANAVYYSVGQSASDLKTGAPNVAITSGVATFDVAQTGNIGVGDVIVANAISYYIASKTSTTVWNVVTNTGAAPADITSTAVTSIKHVYSSLNSAASGSGTLLGTTDLYTNNYQLNIPCYYDSAADTTAVAVQNYATAVPNYIKIYTPNNIVTESNNSQRHSGKWDDTKYRLSTAASYTLNILIGNVKVIGLQASLAPTNDGESVIYFNGDNTNIGNNIVKFVPTAYTTSMAGIKCNASKTNLSAWNNIVYGFNGTTSYGIYLTVANSGAFAYNNTIHNCTNGIMTGNNDTVAKNNIVQGATDGYVNTFATGSDYNISSLVSDTTGGAHDKQAIVQFLSATSGAEDLHLAATDTAAKNSGTDLSADVILAFSTDIDGAARNAAINAWDIGADEAATQIFYSVGQNTTDHKTGSPTVTVSGTTATFSVAQTAVNMGVGDLVTYTGGACFISAKTNADQMHWNCVSATGGTPTQVAGVSVTSIAHAFSSLEGAVDANTASGAFDANHLNTLNLFTNNYQLNIPCYYDTGADTNAVTVQSWTTGPQNYIRIYTPNNTTSEVNQAQRHSGKWDDTKYNLTVTDYTGIYINDAQNYLKFDGLQIKNIGVASGHPGLYFRFNTAGNNMTEISNNIITGVNSGVATGGMNLYNANNNFKVWNNIIYGVGGEGITIPGIGYVYNNTVYGCIGTGIRSSPGATVLAKNNLSYNNLAAHNYYGTFASGSDYNLSNDVTSTAGAHDKINQTVAFANAANSDFHLSPTDTAAKNSGADLTSDANLPFSTDIDGETRHADKWDIGADENNNVNVQFNRNVQLKRNVQIK